MHYISKQLQKEIRGLKHRILYQQREENDRRKERKLKEEEREKTEERIKQSQNRGNGAKKRSGKNWRKKQILSSIL